MQRRGALAHKPHNQYVAGSNEARKGGDRTEEITGKELGTSFSVTLSILILSSHLSMGGARCEEGQGVIRASMMGKGIYGLICVLTRDGYLLNYDTNKPRCICFKSQSSRGNMYVRHKSKDQCSSTLVI